MLLLADSIVVEVAALGSLFVDFLLLLAGWTSLSVPVLCITVTINVVAFTKLIAPDFEFSVLLVNLSLICHHNGDILRLRFVTGVELVDGFDLLGLRPFVSLLMLGPLDHLTNGVGSFACMHAFHSN